MQSSVFFEVFSLGDLLLLLDYVKHEVVRFHAACGFGVGELFRFVFGGELKLGIVKVRDLAIQVLCLLLKLLCDCTIPQLG